MLAPNADVPGSEPEGKTPPPESSPTPAERKARAAAAYLTGFEVKCGVVGADDSSPVSETYDFSDVTDIFDAGQIGSLQARLGAGRLTVGDFKEALRAVAEKREIEL